MTKGLLIRVLESWSIESQPPIYMAERKKATPVYFLTFEPET